MFKKMMLLSVALIVVPYLAADDTDVTAPNAVVAEVDSVVKSGIYRSTVSFLKNHKTASVVTAVVAVCGLYAYNNGYLKKKAIAE